MDGKEVRVGRSLREDTPAALPDELRAQIERHTQEGRTVILVPSGRAHREYCPRRHDRTRDRRSSQRTRQPSCQVVMLTGDQPGVAQMSAHRRHHLCACRIDARGEGGAIRVRARDKGRRWPWWATASTMRPRLPQADVGIAMGTGTDVAMETADLTIVQGDLSVAGGCDRLSGAHRTIRQNLFWALFTMSWYSPRGAGLVAPDVRCGGDGVQFGQRTDQRPPAPESGPGRSHTDHALTHTERYLWKTGSRCHRSGLWHGTPCAR